MLDIHNHMLPRFDDGSSSMEMTLEMLKTARQENIDKIIVTPHYSSIYFKNSFDTVKENTEKIKDKLHSAGIEIELFPGQEVFLNLDTVKKIREGKIKGLNNSRYILIEFPMERLEKYSFDILYEIKLLDYVPIIAHPERYSYILERKELLKELINEECLFQINSGSITGDFGKGVQKRARFFIEQGMCDFIASDAHDNLRRKIELKEAMRIASKYNTIITNEIEENWKLLLNDKCIVKKRKKVEMGCEKFSLRNILIRK